MAWSNVQLQLSQAKGFLSQSCQSSPQPSSLVCWQAFLCCSPSALHKQSQFSQKPTQRLILTGFMPTQAVLTGADKAVTAFQALAIWDGCFTWSTGMAGRWPRDSSPAPDSAATRTVCLPASNDLFLSFFLNIPSFNSAGNSCVSSRHSSDFYHESK